MDSTYSELLLAAMVQVDSLQLARVHSVPAVHAAEDGPLALATV